MSAVLRPSRTVLIVEVDGREVGQVLSHFDEWGEHWTAQVGASLLHGEHGAARRFPTAKAAGDAVEAQYMLEHGTRQCVCRSTDPCGCAGTAIQHCPCYRWPLVWKSSCTYPYGDEVGA